MSVYTVINNNEVKEIVSQYNIGAFVALEPISGGTVNSNYYLTTDLTKYILTIFENMDQNQLTPILDFIDFLSPHNLLVPTTIKDKNDNKINYIKSKPYSIIKLLDGEHPTKINENHIEQIGGWLGKMHTTAENYQTFIPNIMGLDWCKNTYSENQQFIPSNISKIIFDNLNSISALDKTNIGKGIIHADLFRDNVLFLNDNLSGVIDFYYCCTGYFIYDLAILINDWCLNNDSSINLDFKEIVITSYQKYRQLSKEEFKLLPKLEMLAAIRFYLSRTNSKYKKKPGSNILIKNPDTYAKLINYYNKK